MSDNPVEHDEVVASEDVTTEVVDERSDIERQRDEYLDSLQRLQADFENYRKRMARSSSDAAVRAVGDVIVKLLPVLDAFDLAQAHFANVTTDEAAALVQSRALLLDTLAKEGLERIEITGVAFDPQVHDAVAHIEGDGDGEQVIDEVLRAGYLWKGAVLRPAMVRVKG
ncbi:MAG: nucleotide exchange factor GrpE [Acidimicrobiales bacterium]